MANDIRDDPEHYRIDPTKINPARVKLIEDLARSLAGLIKPANFTAMAPERRNVIISVIVAAGMDWWEFGWFYKVLKLCEEARQMGTPIPSDLTPLLRAGFVPKYTGPDQVPYPEPSKRPPGHWAGN